MTKTYSIIESNGRQAIESSLKALTSAIPVIGGPISSLLGDYQNGRKERRLIEFLNNMCDELSDLQDKIDKDFVSKDDFLDIFENTTRKIVITRQEEKRKAFKNILVKSMLANDISYDQVEEYIELVSNLRVEHILMLKVLKDPVKYDEMTGNRVGKGGGNTTSINHIMRKLFPTWTENEIIEIIAKLENERLVHNIVSTFKTMMTDKGIHQITNRLTEKGLKFCDYIEDNAK